MVTAFIKGYGKKYRVSNEGDVYSQTRYVKHSKGGKQILFGRKLKKQTAKSGYQSIALSKRGKAKTFYIHKLVAETFLIKCKGLVIDHIDNNKLNNDASNLRYITQRENTCNRTKRKSNCGFSGVSLNGKYYKKKYRARIRIGNSLKDLGSYSTAKEAGQAYTNHLNKLANGN